MVHGAGHCSGGGGGGFSSGGGFRTTVYTTNYYSGGHRGGGGSDCDCSCCKPCCRAICCISLKPRHRILYVWTVIAILTLIIGLSVSLGHYGKRSKDTSPTDMRHINSGISPQFCSGVQVESDEYPIDVYLLPSKPVINTGNLSTYSYHKYAALEDNSYEYWGFFLLKGSYVTVASCAADSGVDFYLVKGESNLGKWKDDNYCGSCYVIHKTTSGCYSGNSTFNYNVFSSGEYYFIWANHRHYKTSVTANFKLQRTKFDTSSAIHSCKHSEECHLSYSGDDSDQSIVVELPDVNVDNVEIEWQCDRKDGVFAGLFFIMPFGIGVIISTLIYFRCIRRRRKNTSVPYTTLQNENNSRQEYSTFQQPSAPPQQPPPPYSSQAAPPSYEDSVKPPLK